MQQVDRICPKLHLAQASGHHGGAHTHHPNNYTQGGANGYSTLANVRQVYVNSAMTCGDSEISYAVFPPRSPWKYTEKFHQPIRIHWRGLPLTLSRRQFLRNKNKDPQCSGCGMNKPGADIKELNAP